MLHLLNAMNLLHSGAHDDASAHAPVDDNATRVHSGKLGVPGTGGGRRPLDAAHSGRGIPGHEEV